jgi:hypothetical protein
VGSALQYACGHWAMHVRASPTTGDDAPQLIASAAEFFKNNAVPWIEVMSLRNQLEDVIHNIYDLFDWTDKVCTQCDESESSVRSLIQTGRFLYLRPSQPSVRLPPIHHAFLPPHSEICATRLSHRFTPFTDVIKSSFDDPREGNTRRQVLRMS